MTPTRAVYVIRNGKEYRLPNARANPPAPDICDDCGAPISIGDWTLCRGNPTKHEPIKPRRKFEEFEVELDGQVHRVTSLQDADRIERESWARYNSFDSSGKRRGAPLVFRSFHQNYSNRDVNALQGIGEQSKPFKPPVNSRGEPLGYYGPMRRRG